MSSEMAGRGARLGRLVSRGRDRAHARVSKRTTISQPVSEPHRAGRFPPMLSDATTPATEVATRFSETVVSYVIPGVDVRTNKDADARVLLHKVRRDDGVVHVRYLNAYRTASDFVTRDDVMRDFVLVRSGLTCLHVPPFETRRIVAIRCPVSIGSIRHFPMSAPLPAIVPYIE